MKKFVLLVTILVASLHAFAQITFVQAAGNGSGGSSACATGGITNTGACPNPFAPTPGNGVVGVQRTNGSVTPFVQDNNFISLMQGAFVPASPGSQYNSFMGFAASGVTSYTFNQYASSVSDLLAEYSNVGSFDPNPVVTLCSGVIAPDTHSCTGTTTSTNPTMSFNLDESTDVGLCAFTQGLNNTGGVWTGASLGTVRLNYSTAPTQILIEATNVGTVASCGALIGAATNYRILPIIMRPTVIANTTGVIRQITTTGYVGAAGPAGCPVNGNNCHGQFATPLLGDPFFIDFSDHSDFNDIQRFVNTIFLCPVGTGCSSGNGYGWSGGVSTGLVYPSGTCTVYGSDTQPESNGQDTFYNMSALGTESFFDSVRSGANATNERQIFTMTEIIPPVGFHAVFDGCPAPLLAATPSATFTMPTSSFAGSNETLVEALTGGTPVMQAASPFLQNVMVPNHLIVIVATGQTAGTGPVITANGATNGAVGVVRQIKWVANGSGSGNGTMPLLGVGH